MSSVQEHTIDTNVTRTLDRLGIPYRVAVHDKPALTVQEAAAQRGMRPGQLVKTMVLRLPDDTHIAALVPGDRDVDLKSIRGHLGVRRLSWVAREDVLALTGYPPGAVSPVGIGGVSMILADPALANEGEVAISSGSPGAGIRLAATDLLRVIDARLIPIGKATPPAVDAQRETDGE